MTDKIVPFVTSAKICNQETIDLLKLYLERAENGEINEVAIVGMTPDGASWPGWSKTSHIQAMVGGIEMMKCQLLAKHLE